MDIKVFFKGKPQVTQTPQKGQERAKMIDTSPVTRKEFQTLASETKQSLDLLTQAVQTLDKNNEQFLLFLKASEEKQSLLVSKKDFTSLIEYVEQMRTALLEIVEGLQDNDALLGHAIQIQQFTNALEMYKHACMHICMM